MAGTLPGMRVRHAFALLIVLAAACGGNADAGPGADDYFAKLERTSETATSRSTGSVVTSGFGWKRRRWARIGRTP